MQDKTVKINPKLHQHLKKKALHQGITLQKFVELAILEKIQRSK